MSESSYEDQILTELDQASPFQPQNYTIPAALTGVGLNPNQGGVISHGCLWDRDDNSVSILTTNGDPGPGPFDLWVYEPGNPLGRRLLQNITDITWARGEAGWDIFTLD